MHLFHYRCCCISLYFFFFYMVLHLISWSIELQEAINKSVVGSWQTLKWNEDRRSWNLRAACRLLTLAWSQFTLAWFCATIVAASTCAQSSDCRRHWTVRKLESCRAAQMPLWHAICCAWLCPRRSHLCIWECVCACACAVALVCVCCFCSPSTFLFRW